MSLAVAHDVALADGVAALLNHEDRQWTIPFQAERVYVPDWDVKRELKELQVCTYPEARTATSAERTAVRKELRIGLGFAQRLREKTRDELDGLLALVQSVNEYLEPNTNRTHVVRLADNRTFACTGWEDRTRFDPDQLDREKRDDGVIVYSGAFLAVMSFTYLFAR